MTEARWLLLHAASEYGPLLAAIFAVGFLIAVGAYLAPRLLAAAGVDLAEAEPEYVPLDDLLTVADAVEVSLDHRPALLCLDPNCAVCRARREARR